MIAAAVRSWDCCYFATPEHVASLVGRFLYIYTDKGRLDLDGAMLTYTSPEQAVVIPLAAIEDVTIGHYSRWAKPLRLDYLAVTYRDGDGRRTILLTPTTSAGWATPIPATNAVVADLSAALRKALGKGFAMPEV